MSYNYIDRFEHIVKLWKKRSEETKEYEIVKEPQQISEEFFNSSYVLEEEYQKALQLKKQLMKKYKDIPLNKAIQGNIIKNPLGECYEITNYTNIDLEILDKTSVRFAILSKLSLVYGIGDVHERELKRRGYNNIKDLVTHLRWRYYAKEFLNILESNDLNSLLDYLVRKKNLPS